MSFWEKEHIFTILYDSKQQNGYVAIESKKDIVFNNNKDVDFDNLDRFTQLKEWKFGFISYDLKNNIEQLSSGNNDNLDFPILHLFIPKTLIKIENNTPQLIYGNDTYLKDVTLFIKQLNSSTPPNFTPVKFSPSLSKDEYTVKVENIINELKKGNIYEANFCYEFSAKNTAIPPADLFIQLHRLTKAPFACFGRFDDKYIISASPERFLKHNNGILISEPIKGTIKRGKNKAEDILLKESLRNNPKEISENVMIVDLVRNDFSRIAQYDSVKVEELCTIYSFDTVHQMISKISCRLDNGTSFSDILKATFPMGSMTGAPKISAMNIIEREEITRRGVYSGSVGYITPDGNFDFNVVIRTFLYNSTQRYLSAMVGGAITIKSNPEQEYNETLTKIDALLKALSLPSKPTL